MMKNNIPLIILSAVVVVSLYYGWNELQKINYKMNELDVKIEDSKRQINVRRHDILPIIHNSIPQPGKNTDRIPMPKKNNSCKYT